MQRRNLLMFGLALAPGVAMAQTGAAPGSKGGAEEQHALKTLSIGGVSLQASQIAQKKAKTEWVVKFVQYEIAEQQLVAEVLRTMTPASAASTGRESDVVRKLQEITDPAKFEAQFIADQIEGHNELAKAQDEYISAGRNGDHLNVVKLIRGQINEHLDILKTIQSSIRA